MSSQTVLAGFVFALKRITDKRYEYHRQSERRRRRGLCIVLLIAGICSLEAVAAPPTLTHLSPAGGQRGTTVTVSCAGSFAWPPKVFAPGVEVVPAADSGKLQVTIPADLAADRVWIRLYDAEGASTTMPFLIGSLPELEEVEPNDKFREPHVIPSPNVVVNGVLKDAEVDCFAVTLTAGQSLIAALDANTRLGSPMDSILQIVTKEGIVLAENHDDLNIDPRLTFVAPEEGTYVVRIFGFPSTPNSTIRFNGGAGHIYRLTLTTGPFATHALPLSVSTVNPIAVSAAGWNLPAEQKLTVVPFGGKALAEYQEFEPLADLRRMSDSRIGFAFTEGFAISTRVRMLPASVNSLQFNLDPQGPMTLAVSSSITGCLRVRKQTDEYRIPLVKGQQLLLSSESRSFGAPLDTVLRLFDPSGNAIAESDDTGANRDSVLAYTAAADGEFRVTVADRFRKGSDRFWYLLTARLDQPDFELSSTVDAIVVPHDKPAEITVKVARRGSTEAVGGIVLRAVGLPEGVLCPEVASEATGPTAAEVKLTITSNGAPFSGPIRIVGKSSGPTMLERTAHTPVRLEVTFDSIWATILEKPK